LVETVTDALFWLRDNRPVVWAGIVLLAIVGLARNRRRARLRSEEVAVIGQRDGWSFALRDRTVTRRFPLHFARGRHEGAANVLSRPGCARGGRVFELMSTIDRTDSARRRFEYSCSTVSLSVPATDMMVLPRPNLDFGTRSSVEVWWTSITSRLRSLETGNAAFDREWVVRARDKNAAARMLNEAALQRILSIESSFVGLQVFNQQLVLGFETTLDPSRAGWIMARADELADCFDGSQRAALSASTPLPWG
jgi:hypothetical protein